MNLRTARHCAKEILAANGAPANVPFYDRGDGSQFIPKCAPTIADWSRKF